jgi:hypothetical protein
MEADWEFEMAPDEAGVAAPIIDALWRGCVDLQRFPEMVSQLPEAAQFPALGVALVKLNAATSPVWSSKCDFWPCLEADEFHADELDAPSDCAAHAMGCYIDLLPRSGQQWRLPEIAAVCKQICRLLRAVPLKCCRGDLVIRRALLTGDQMEMGITLYLTACGASSAESERTLQAALGAITDAFCRQSTLECNGAGE